MDINVILFNNFETLDVFGPVEIFGILDDEYKIKFLSMDGSIITSKQGVKVVTDRINVDDYSGILFVPGGLGTRDLVHDIEFVELLKVLDNMSEYTLTVCTGSALLARTGHLKGITATSNKRSFDWVKDQDKDVLWESSARWCVDGKYYTSSGVSAGMDMSLGFIKDMFSEKKAFEVAKRIEYIWNDNMKDDPFAV